jgi:hypothetical protein
MHKINGVRDVKINGVKINGINGVRDVDFLEIPSEYARICIDDQPCAFTHDT